MEAAAPRHHADAVLFEDGLGQRLPAADDATGVERHLLVVRGTLAASPSFEFQLRERLDRLSAVRHPHVARALEVRAAPGESAGLSVLFDAPAGIRLSELLRGAQARQVPVGINAALSVVRQLAPALAALQEGDADLAHGALAAERLVITPDARVIVLDHVLGAALEQLRYSRERYWSELRVAVPPSATPRLDQRADVLQLGLVALALILGRPIRLEEFPSRIPEVVASTAAVSPTGGYEPLPAGVRGWLARALQIGPERPFATAAEARDAFDRILGNGELLASPSELASFLSRYASADPAGATRVSPDHAALPLRVPSSAANSHATSAGGPSLQLVAAQTAQVTGNDAEVLALAAPVSTYGTRAASATRSPLTPRPSQRSATQSDCAEPADGDWTAQIDDPASPRWWWNWRLVCAFVLLAGIVSASGSLGAARQLLQLVDSPRGTLELTSIPAGADVFIDGVQKGTTPLVLSIASGAHDVELRAGRMRRAFGVIVADGEKVTQRIKLQRTDVKGRGAKAVGAAKAPRTTPDAAVAVSTAGTWPHANAVRVGDGLGERSALPPPQSPGSTR